MGRVATATTGFPAGLSTLGTPAESSARLASLDAFRGLVILTMVVLGLNWGLTRAGLRLKF